MRFLPFETLPLYTDYVIVWCKCCERTNVV